MNELKILIKKIYNNVLEKITTSIYPLIEKNHIWDEILSIINSWFEKNSIYSEIKHQLKVLDALKFYDQLPIKEFIHAIKQDIKNTYHKDWNLKLSKKTKEIIMYEFEVPIKAYSSPESFELYNKKTGKKIPTIREINNESTILTIPDYGKIDDITATAEISCLGKDAIPKITVEKNGIKGVCMNPIKDLKSEKKEL